ncbi:MAG: hypothetical protein LIP23_00350, partial [Planctomycetes bacterium]|nr:hypothetical protein [Planctomycetota bacterium]
MAKKNKGGAGDWIIYAIARTALTAMSFLPLSACRWIGRRLGGIFRRLAPRPRVWAEQNVMGRL